MSGNGIRCLVQAAVDAGLVRAGHRSPVRHRSAGSARWSTGRRGPGLGYGRVDMGAAALGAELGRRRGRSACRAGPGASTWATPIVVLFGAAGRRRHGARASGAGLRAVGRPAGPTWSSCGPAPAPASSPCGCGSAAWARPWPAAPARAPRRPPPTRMARSGRRVRGAQPGRRPRGRARRRPGSSLAGPTQKVATSRWTRPSWPRWCDEHGGLAPGDVPTRWRRARDADRAQLPRAHRAGRRGVPLDVGRRGRRRPRRAGPAGGHRRRRRGGPGRPAPRPARPGHLRRAGQGPGAARAVARRSTPTPSSSTTSSRPPSSATWRRSSGAPPSTAPR